MRPASLGAIVLIVVSFSAEPILAQGRGGGGPPFCRNGEGHPVHGWAWCVSKGWAPRGYLVPAYGWQEVHWGDARFRHRRPVRDDPRWLDRRDVVEVVGEVVLGRLEAHERGRENRRTQPTVRARWISGDFDGVALEVQVGSRPVAYLHDRSLDGRVDRIFLRPR